MPLAGKAQNNCSGGRARRFVPNVFYMDFINVDELSFPAQSIDAASSCHLEPNLIAQPMGALVAKAKLFPNMAVLDPEG